MFHGFADALISPQMTIDYYLLVQGALQQEDQDQAQALADEQSFFRLFLAPGMGHCSGGPGPNAFGQLGGTPVPVDAQHDVLRALVRWVKTGEPPSQVVATKYVNDTPANGVLMTRPLCPFPKLPQYVGSGDPTDAANFVCVDDGVHHNPTPAPVVDATGRIVREAKLASEPGILIEWFGSLGLAVTRIGLEAGPLSQWLYAGMRDAGLAVELLETRHVRDAFKAKPVKTDRKDARGIAQLMRLGWFRPVHCKSLPAQEVRALLTARKLLQTKNHDVEMSLRGVLRGFGRKVGPTTPRTFPGRIRELVAGHATLSTVAEALLAARGMLFEQWQKLEKRLRSLEESVTARSALRPEGTSADRGFRAGRPGGGVAAQYRDGSA